MKVIADVYMHHLVIPCPISLFSISLLASSEKFCNLELWNLIRKVTDDKIGFDDKEFVGVSVHEEGVFIFFGFLVMNDRFLFHDMVAS